VPDFSNRSQEDRVDVGKLVEKLKCNSLEKSQEDRVYGR
jgi:hypothetical protein